MFSPAVPPSVFVGLEAFIRLDNADEQDEVCRLFEQHGGALATTPGRESTTHAILDRTDSVISTPQVPLSWVHACIDAGEVIDEHRFPFLQQNKKRKAHSSLDLTSLTVRPAAIMQVSMLPQAIAPPTPLGEPAPSGAKSKKARLPGYEKQFGLKFFFSKQGAKDHYGPNCFWFKYGNKLFAGLSDRATFLELCVQMYNELGYLAPLYELVHGDAPRLYLDIEVEYDSEQEQDVMNNVITRVLAVVQGQLAKLTGLPTDDARFLDTMVTANHRWKVREADNKQMWNLSSHVVFPRVTFEHNDRGMKDFVQQSVDAELKKEDSLMWMKKCKREWEMRTAVDQRTYAYEQAFRVVFTSKEGKEHRLLPYDLKSKRHVVPQSEQELLEMLSRNLISKADTTGDSECLRITDKQVATFLGRDQPSPAFVARERKTREREQKEELKEERVLHAAASEPERDFVAHFVLPNLNKKRYDETPLWLHVGYGLGSVFGGDQVGLDLFNHWSKTSSNYGGEKKCEEIYSASNGRIGFGSFVVWLKEDAPDIGNMLHKRFCQQQDDALRAVAEAEQDDAPPVVAEELDLRLNVVKLDAWWKAYEKQKREIQKRLSDAVQEEDWGSVGAINEELKAHETSFDRTLCTYMNNYLAVITKLPEPAYLEVYGEPDKVEKKMVARKHNHLVGTYRNRDWMKFWVNSNERREFDRITFNPEAVGHSEYEYNLFNGLAHPGPKADKKGNPPKLDALMIKCRPLIQHIDRLWCQGNRKHARFTMKWFAHQVQRPGVKMGSSIVLRGDEGCGKGVVIQLLAEVLGLEHFYQVQDAENTLFSRFTPENFERCLLLFVDEAVWGGSRAQAGKLKKLVTEALHDIEHKHGVRFTVRSFLNLIFASNERWVVPTGFKARRFFCLDVEFPKVASLVAYFKAIRDIPIEAFANLLHLLDITDFNPRCVPVTDMLRDQKRRRFDSVAAFWDDLLQNGKILVPYEHVSGDSALDPSKGSLANVKLERDWGKPIPNDELFAMYKEHRGQGSRGGEITRASDLIRELRNLCEFGNKGKCQRTVDGLRKYVTVLPTLEQAKKHFCEKLDDPLWFSSREGLDDEEDKES